MSRALERARTNGPRFSIVPPAAAFDMRLEPLDVRLLMVFGAHVDKQGWCSRSQIKMAAQLGCGRSTVQRAIRRLVEAGYLEQRELLREDGGDRAHAYRVCFEPDAPETEDFGLGEGDPEDGPDASDAPQTAERPCPPAGAPAHQRAPLPTASSEPRAGGAHDIQRAVGAHKERPFLNEGERERGREDEGKASEGLDAFRRAWPTTAVDDPVLVEAAWRRLAEDERAEALAGVPVFLAALKASRRSHVPGAASYLGHKRWRWAAEQAKAAKAGEPEAGAWAKAWAKPWWASILIAAESGVRPDALRRIVSLANQGAGSRIVDRRAVEERAATLKETPTDSPRAKAWAEWFKARGADFDLRFSGKRFWVFLPDHDPPAEARAETIDEMADEMARRW